QVTEGVRYRPGTGLSLRSEDGDFELTLRARLQLQGEVAAEDGAAPALGLAVRRARLTVQGHLYGEDNRFKLELALSPQDQGLRDSLTEGRTPNTIPLLDYYLDFR